MNSNADLEHLRMLSVFHYVMAGMAGMASMSSVAWLLIGAAMVSESRSAGPFGWMFILSALFCIFVAGTIAICAYTAARHLAEREGYQFCLIVAGIECLFAPLGTILGVFTIIVLCRESVKELFDANAAT
jgi:hypothetical protein